MRTFILTRAARHDLDDIWRYLTDHANAEVALDVLSEIRHAMVHLSMMPGMGHMRPDLAPESFRFWRVHSYFVVYHFGTKPLSIARVLHAAMDIERELADTN
jgi:toxin ParE1/3/4